MDINIPEEFNEDTPDGNAFNDWLEAQIVDFKRTTQKHAKGIRIHHTMYLLMSRNITSSPESGRHDDRFFPCTRRHKVIGGMMGYFMDVHIQLCAASADHKRHISISDEQYPLLTKGKV